MLLACWSFCRMNASYLSTLKLLRRNFCLKYLDSLWIKMLILLYEFFYSRSRIELCRLFSVGKNCLGHMKIFFLYFSSSMLGFFDRNLLSPMDMYLLLGLQNWKSILKKCKRWQVQMRKEKSMFLNPPKMKWKHSKKFVTSSFLQMYLLFWE